MLSAVQPLWIETFPPLAFALDRCQIAIVRDARHETCRIGTMCCLKPPPIASLMHSNAETQPLLASRFRPDTHHVAVRPHVDGVPRLMLRSPGVKSIMMIRE